MSGEPQKEAVVFILDAHPSMLKEYSCVADAPVKKHKVTRLQAAQNALEMMIQDRLINGRKDSLASVIVTKTLETRHHLKNLDDDDDTTENSLLFPNLTQLCYNYDGEPMKCPTAALVQELWKVTPVESVEQANQNMQGDICDALILAADTLFRATTNKNQQPLKFRREIVLLTDVGHPVVLDMAQLMVIIDGLRKLENTPIHVLGIGFRQETIEFKKPLENPKVKMEPDSPVSNKRIKSDPDAVVSHEDEPMPDAVKSEDPNSNNEDPNLVYYERSRDREKLLASIAEKTGGSVVSVGSLQELLDEKAGQRTNKLTKKKMQLHVGPGLTVDVHKLPLVQAEKTPPITKRVMDVYDDDGNLEQIKNEYSYWRRQRPDEEDDKDDDENNNNMEDKEAEIIGGVVHTNVVEHEISNAIRYGKDLVPVGEFDMEGLKADLGCGYPDDTLDLSKPYIHIINYANRDSVQYQHLIGPPWALTGVTDSKTGRDYLQSYTVVAALAEKMDELNFLAIASYKLTADGKPALAVLYPFPMDLQPPAKPTHLMGFRLPFAEDIKGLQFESFAHILQGDEEEEEDENETEEDKAERLEEKEQAAQDRAAKEQASDALIDAMMLGDKLLCSDQIPSPYHTAFYKTILKRSVDGKDSEIVNVRGDLLDKMTLPEYWVEQAQPSFDQFRQAFPLKKNKIKKLGKKMKKGAPTYTDHLPED